MLVTAMPAGRESKKSVLEEDAILIRKYKCCYIAHFKNIKTQTLTFIFHSTIQHEFLHALGAYHVQSRPDRDNYVEIKWDNIKESQKHNFKKHSSALTYGLAYDPLSIMHYEYYAFAINKKKPTIVSKVCEHKSCLETKSNCSSVFRCQVYQPKNLDQLKQ